MMGVRKYFVRHGTIQWSPGPLDVTDLSRADPLLRREIMFRGTLLFGDEMDFLAYKAFAFRDYIDSQDLRDLEEEQFRKKIRFIREQTGYTHGKERRT